MWSVLDSLYSLSDDVLYLTYIPLCLLNAAVALAFGHWAAVLFREATPMLRHLVLGIAVQFAFNSLEQSCVAYYRFTDNYVAWGQNYPLLLSIKLGYLLAAALHLYGYLTASGRRKWFWRLVFLLPAIVALQAGFGFGMGGELPPLKH